MADKDCIFCKIAAGQIPCNKIYEDENVLAFLDIGPLSDGHTLIIPKQHYTRMHECPPQVVACIGSVLPKVAGAVFNVLAPDGYNVLCNNGRASGQLVEHLHFHIIPRKAGDGIFTQWPAHKYPQGRVEKLAADIRAKL